MSGVGGARGDVEDGMELLSIGECSQYLRGEGVGILALCGTVEPVLRPVNYVVHRESLIIRTGEGRIFEAARRFEPASFAISHVDRLEHTGWSVVVTGKLTLRSESDGLDDLPLRPWVRAEKNRFVELSQESVSGRRIAEIAQRWE